MTEIRYTKQDLKKISLEFRNVSSRLLRSHTRDSTDNLKRFLNCVASHPIISTYINSKITQEFEVSNDLKNRHSHEPIPIPTDQAMEISYIFQLMQFLVVQEDGIEANCYGFGSGNKMQDHVNGFMHRVFQPLINHVNSHLENLMIDAGDGDMASTVINVSNSHGVNIANNNSRARLTTGSIQVQFETMASSVLQSLEQNKNIDTEQKNEIKDYVEFYLKEIKSTAPSIGIMSKMLTQLKVCAEGINTHSDAYKNLKDLIMIIGAYLSNS